MLELKVELGERSYPIYIGAGCLAMAECFASHIKGRKVMIVTNETVSPLYEAQLRKSLAGFEVDCVVLPDGEAYKNWDSLSQIFDALLESAHSRQTTIVALGGGVVGDMAGFAAASYQRGVDFLQVPTTVLSQVDSSVGGKTAINHPLGKNMIGAFYQPKAVVIDTLSLQTLPEREVSAGIAEIIKYGLIRDVSFFEWLEENVERLVDLDQEALVYAIETSCACKAEVVEADELEGGVRAHLNLGHTFGHAIEAFCGYGRWLHGEAVSAGMMMAAELSYLRGDLTKGEVERIEKLLVRAKLPVKGPVDMQPDDYHRLMKLDKKVLDGRVRFVLLKTIGQAVVTDQYLPADLDSVLKQAASLPS